MTARIKSELAVGVTPEIREAVEIACEFTGMKQSQAATMQIAQHLAGQQGPSQPVAEPEPFRPQQSVQLPPEPDRSSHYSAPVSRQAPSGNGRREPNASQVKLSPLQREAAMLAGISEVEYARNLQKLPEWKRQRGVESE